MAKGTRYQSDVPKPPQVMDRAEISGRLDATRRARAGVDEKPRQSVLPSSWRQLRLEQCSRRQENQNLSHLLQRPQYITRLSANLGQSQPRQKQSCRR